jgi:hypothetical protein
MKLEMTNFRALAANLVVEGEVCDLAQAEVSTQTETDTTEIAPLIQQVGATSIAEIDRLIADLQGAKSYLQSEGERIERETVRYTNLTQMASFTAKIIFDAISQWHPASNQQNASESRRLRPRTPSVRPGRVIITVTGIRPNSVRRLMPLRGRNPSSSFATDEPPVNARLVSTRVGQLIRSPRRRAVAQR